MCQIKTNDQKEKQDKWLGGAYEGIWTERGANDFNNQYYKVWRDTYPAVCSSLINLSLVCMMILLSPGFEGSEYVLEKESRQKNLVCT